MKESYKILVTHLSFQFALRGILQIADVTCCVNQNVLFFLYLCAELNLAYLAHSMHCHNMAVKRLLVEQYFATFLTFSIFVITVFFLHVSVKVTVRLVSSSTYWATLMILTLVFQNSPHGSGTILSRPSTSRLWRAIW